jgi:methyl-accepting chemotaxis protein
MGDKDNRSQNRFLVNFKFQLKYSLMVVLLSSAVFVGLGYKFYQSEVGKQKLLEIQNPDILEMVQSQDHNTLYYLAAFFIVQILSIMLLGIILTHRIAGPIFRIEKDLEKSLETGEMPVIRPVRKNDEFQGFFDTLHKFIQKVSKK